MNPAQKQTQPKRRRFLSLLSALCLLISGVVTVNFTDAQRAAASVGTDDYPWSAYNGPGSNASTYTWYDPTGARWLSPLGFAYRNCTDYAAYEINEQMGGDVAGNIKFKWANIAATMSDNTQDGNAKSWALGATQHFGANSVNSTPAIGSVAWWGADEGGGYGHVAIVTQVNHNADGSVKNVVIADYNSGVGGWGNYDTHTLVPTGTNTYLKWPEAFLHLADVSGGGSTSTSYPDNTFLSSSNGHVYEMVGNAALQLNQWSDVGGQHTTTAVSQSVVAGMPTVPGNGTFVTDYATGHVYEIVGGSPMLVTSWSAIGGQQPIDAVVADSMLTSMAAQPVDGSFVADYSTSHVYVVAGGALMLITSWSAVGGQHDVAMLDDWAIQHQFRQYPANGVFVVDYATSHVFEIVGGAPLLVTSWNAIGGQQPATVIDDWALQNQFKTYPDDGSFVADYATSHVYVVAGGSLLLITNWNAVGGQRPVAVIDDWAASNQFRTYPADGTYVQGYGSGEEFQASGGTVSRVTTSPLPAATTVDDWAILNQLGGTE